MREEDNLVKQVSEILRDIEELKTRQPVGSDQVEIIDNATEDQLVTTEVWGPVAYIRLSIEARASDIGRDNVLLAFCKPEVKSEDGTIVINHGAPLYVIDPILDPFGKSNRWVFSLIDTRKFGIINKPEPKKFWVKFHVYASAKANVTVKEGMIWNGNQAA